jgi:hypothetical protein
MFEGEYDLTFEEEAQIEQPANIYSIVRTLDFIEWAYNTGHIDKDTYFEHSNLILDQYKNSVEAFQDKFAGIDNFAQVRIGLIFRNMAWLILNLVLTV